MSDDERLAARVAELAAQLEARGLKFTCAESCTGGWLAKCLTDRPGSSAWFEFGFVTYGNNAKLALRASALLTACGLAMRRFDHMSDAQLAGAEVPAPAQGLRP